MMKVFALMAEVDCDRTFPCMVWAADDITKPLADCVELMGDPKRSGEGWARWNGEESAESCFMSYYGGHREIDKLTLQEIPQGKAFLVFES